MIPDLGIELGRCNRDVIGAVIGSQFGKGSERTVATIGGTIVGVLIGGATGRSMDETDQACIAQTLEQALAQQAVAWSNPVAGTTRTTRGASAVITASPPPSGGASSSSTVLPAGSPMGAGSG